MHRSRSGHACTSDKQCAIDIPTTEAPRDWFPVQFHLKQVRAVFDGQQHRRLAFPAGVGLYLPPKRKTPSREERHDRVVLIVHVVD